MSNVFDRDLLNQLQILSTAITEMLELEIKMVSEFRQFGYVLTGRKEYLSFWLRAQSFFITAQSLTDRYELKDIYNDKIDKSWQTGVKVLRHFFAHEIKIIPSIHSAVRFIPERNVSVSFRGFAISAGSLRNLFIDYVRYRTKCEIRKQSKGGQKNISFSNIRKIYRKYFDSVFPVLNEWRSRPNYNVVSFTDIASRHYLYLCDMFDLCVSCSAPEVSYRCSGCYISDGRAMNKFCIKREFINETVLNVIKYRRTNFDWGGCVNQSDR